MKLDFKNMQNGVDMQSLLKKTGDFIVRKEAYFLFLIFAILLGYCGYLWYGFVYQYQWDEAKRIEYMNTKKAGVFFDKNKFERVLNGINARQDEYQKEAEVKKDIFKLK
ncbi:MAG: hypothetical protein PHP62_05180 [Candidatus Moranbacteria bacterium]|nr:hypothetical protein [Candidatus Moranbacteria bacterium]